MHRLNIVMVEPEIPQNTGNVARTCSVTGARLHLVGPLGFRIDDRKLKRAGLDYWDKLDITMYDSLDDFFLKNRDIPADRFFFYTTKAQHRHTDVSYPEDSWIFFGKETKGLPEDLLLRYPEQCVRIPMRTDLRSLNLSNAVAIGSYEVLRQWNYPDLQTVGELHDHHW